MPIEKEIRERERLALAREVDDILLYRVNHLGREVLLLEGNDPMAVEGAFTGFLFDLKQALLITEEPMMNIVGSMKKEMASYDLSAPKTSS